MRTLKVLLVVIVLAAAVVAGWQVAASELANIELRDDMKDLSSQLGGRIGLTSPNSDEDFRQAVIAHAMKYGIELTPEQITVQRSGTGTAADIYLAADYEAPIHLPGLTFNLHFTPSAGRRPR